MATARPEKPAQRKKIDASGRYSHRQHIASFAGFAPVNNPAVTVLVVLDSPAGGYPKDGGGEAAAPVFARIAQQVLAYMNVPHDVELQDPRRMWLRAHTKEDDTAEAAPDYIASAQENVDTPGAATLPQVPVSAAFSACAARSKVADCCSDKQVDAASAPFRSTQPAATLQKTAFESKQTSRAEQLSLMSQAAFLFPTSTASHCVSHWKKRSRLGLSLKSTAAEWGWTSHRRQDREFRRAVT